MDYERNGPRITTNTFRANMKIDFGCGSKPKQGFVGCDVNDSPGIKYVCDCWDIGVYVDECTVEEIYSRHMFEHLSFINGERTLQAWYRILKPGGIIKMEIPDLLYHIKQYLQYHNNRNVLSAVSHRKKVTEFEHAIGSLFGWQREADTQMWDIHKSGYDEQTLKNLFTKHKFNNFKRLPSKPWNLLVEAYK